MKLLLDHNLSPRLVSILRDLYPGSVHVREVQLHTLARKPAQSSCTPVTDGFLGNLKARIETGIGIPARVYGTEI